MCVCVCNILFNDSRSGKIVCTGARNEHDSYIAARKFARIIQKLGFPVITLIVTINSSCYYY